MNRIVQTIISGVPGNSKSGEKASWSWKVSKDDEEKKSRCVFRPIDEVSEELNINISSSND